MANEPTHLGHHKSWHMEVVEILVESLRLLAELEIVQCKSILIFKSLAVSLRTTRLNVHGARFALSVLYGYQNRQRLFPYTSLTAWLL